jgi:hypothetical protein
MRQRQWRWVSTVFQRAAVRRTAPDRRSASLGDTVWMACGTCVPPESTAQTPTAAFLATRPVKQVRRHGEYASLSSPHVVTVVTTIALTSMMMSKIFVCFRVLLSCWHGSLDCGQLLFQRVVLLSRGLFDSHIHIHGLLCHRHESRPAVQPERVRGRAILSERISAGVSRWSFRQRVAIGGPRV